MRVFLGFPLLVCSLGLVGCGSTVIDESSHYTLAFVQTGGFAGVDQTTKIDNQTKVISFVGDQGGSKKSSLTDAEIAALTEVLNTADIPGSPGPYQCSGCADQFTDAAHLVLDGATYQSQWDSDETSPSALLGLSREMTTLIERKFPGSL
jgi:hypothetical protein